MKLLFEIDKKNYNPNGKIGRRPSARGIIFRDNKLAVIISKTSGYCKIPGGGVEKGEDNITAMIREVREEAGLIVIPETVKEFGYVHRVQKGKREDIFIQDNFYYTCQVEDTILEQKLSPSEKEEQFYPCFIPVDEAIKINKDHLQKDPSCVMTQRELKVMEIIKENLI